MSTPLKASIDVSKISKAHLQVGKDGRKWLNLTIFEKETDFSTHTITQDCGKDAEGNWIKGEIIGNIKKPKISTSADVKPKAPKPAADSPDDDVPF